jgi:hypothetical protein
MQKSSSLPMPNVGHDLPHSQFNLPPAGARSASIARLIRAHTSRPSSSPRSTIKS